MDIDVRKGGLRDSPNREHRKKSILLDVTLADPQAQAYLRADSVADDGSAASTPEAPKRRHYSRLGHVSFNERRKSLATLAVENFGRLVVEGGYIYRAAGCKRHGREGWRVSDEEGRW